MSLILAYHNPDFGIVCTDGRVSIGMPAGHRVAVPEETERKFIVLRASPGLVLAGSSSVSKWLDFSVYDAVRRYVENLPDASFDQVAGIIVPTVYEAETEFRVPSDARMNLNLLGFDRERMCVRNRAFAFTGYSCNQSEYESGAVVSGFVEPEEAFPHKLLELMRNERTPQAAREAMLSLAAEISASRPEIVGPPYFFHIITTVERP